MTTEIPLVLVTEGNVQATTFTTYLMAQLGEPIRLISHPDQLLAIENCNLFLIDLDYLQVEPAVWLEPGYSRLRIGQHDITQCADQHESRSAAAVAQYQRSLLSSGSLGSLGSRYQEGDAGEFWIPRHLMRAGPLLPTGHGASPTHQNLLTVREREIIRYLMTEPPIPR